MSFTLNEKKLNILTTVNAGRGPQPNPEENISLARDYAAMPENGMTMADLVVKYHSAPKNLYDRLERMGVPRHKKIKSPRKAKKDKPFWEGKK